MDGDDSLFLNFAPASSGGPGRPPKRRAVHEVEERLRGTWKRRRVTAQKIVSRQAKKAKDTRSGAGAGAGAAAKARADGANGVERPQPKPAPLVPATATTVNGGTAPDIGQTEGHGQRRKGKERDGAESRLRVSSLFTGNPSVDIARLADEVKTVAAEAEPIFDSGSFAGLGLHRLLADHLANRMNTARPTAIQALSLPALCGAREVSRGRDAVIQAQTGSGKTLAYLLPIVDCLMRIEDRGASRRSGCFAIVLAPTRELARQIYGVLESVLNVSGRSVAKKDAEHDGSSSSDDEEEDASDLGRRRPRWIVPGLVVGGDNKKSEKARLRKGINILVSTPGRLLDHLRNTRALDVSKIRWLVLDEADRLMDLGFEETIREILECLDREQKRVALLESWQEILPSRRVTWLCSATMKGQAMERLRDMSVNNPVVLADKADDHEDENEEGNSSRGDVPAGGGEHGDLAAEHDLEHSRISVPNQLRQSYLVVPAKQRLVVLISLLRAATVGGRGKVITFVSSQDSVDFLWTLLGQCPPHLLSDGKKAGRVKAGAAKVPDGGSDSDNGHDAGLVVKKAKPGVVAAGKGQKQEVHTTGSLLPGVSLYRLHGNMPQSLRTSTFHQFVRAECGILICTDVAARGLDLPDVTSILQYDPPADYKDYVHRAGRTARLGRAGKAIIMLLPSEVEYVDLLSKEGFILHSESADAALENLVKLGRTGAAQWKKVAREEVEKAATDIQMDVERWVLSTPEHVELARRAFTSHVRSYATHGAAEKHIFHPKKLHLGHLAKSFGLREAPSDVGAGADKKQAFKVHDKAKSAAMHRGQEGQQKRKQLVIAEFGDGMGGSQVYRGPAAGKKRKKGM